MIFLTLEHVRNNIITATKHRFKHKIISLQNIKNVFKLYRYFVKFCTGAENRNEDI